MSAKTRFFAGLLIALASPVFATDPQFGAIRVEATQNVRHAFVSAQSQSANSNLISRNEWNAAHTAPAVVLLTIPTGITWPAQPAAVTEFCGVTTFRFRATLTDYTSIRLSAQVITAGAATSALRLQYTTDTTGAAGWAYLDSVSGPSVSTSASGLALSATVTIADAAKADVLLRIVGINGDGVGGTCTATLKAATAALADSATVATALASDPADCSAGQFPLGINAAGAAQSCTALPTTIAGTANQITASAATGSITLSIPTNPTLPGTTTGTFSGNVTGNVTGSSGSTTGNAATATALAANASNCSAGSYARGVDASGAAEDCTAVTSFTAEAASTATYCADAGASDAYACNLSPAPASYAAIIGVPLTFLANTVNTGAGTISFNSLGAQAIVKVGATTTTALVTNDIRAGSLVTVQWDGANFQCISCNGNYANLGIANTWSQSQLFPDGTASVPSMGWFSDSDGSGTGFYRRATNRITVTMNGTAGFEFADGTIYMPGANGYTFTTAIGGGERAVLRSDATGLVRAGSSPTKTSGFLGGGAAVASATAMPLPTGRVFHVTGTTTITSITSTNFESGAVITLVFDGILTLTDGSNLKLAGDFVTTADDTITLVFDGSSFFEVSRSVN